MSKRQQAPTSGNVSLDGSPPFLPLEDTMRSRSDTETSMDNNYDKCNNIVDDSDNSSSAVALLSPQSATTTARLHHHQHSFSKGKHHHSNPLLSRLGQKLKPKTIILCLVGSIFALIIWQSFFVKPENRVIQPDFGDKFLDWVESNPVWGLGAILIVIAGAVVSMVPIGTPLTLGCGYIYRGVYGWRLGLFVSTLVSMAGSTLGAVICFLLGRYLMRDTVKRWVRNYPLFDAIDVAASQHGLKIMAMLYLTPVIPLGLVSYACGTTTMDVSVFALAKIASLPLYLLYTFIGASAHSFIKRGAQGNGNISQSVSAEAKKLEENQFILVAGLFLSVVMMTLITRHIRKELMKILDQQKKENEGDLPLLSTEADGNNGDDVDEKTIELGLTARRKTNTKLAVY